MNKARRKQIEAASAGLDEAMALIVEIGSDESEAFENLPEGIQESDMGSTMQEAIDQLESAATMVEDAIDALTEAGA